MAHAWYLERLDIYKHEKPYMFTFDVSNLKGQRTNHRYKKYPVSMADARQQETEFQINTHGFEFRTEKTALRGQDFADDELIQSKYYIEIEKMMQRMYPEAVRIHIFAHLRRQRPRGFLGEAKDQHTAAPIAFVHADFSPHGAAQRLASVLDQDKSLQACRFEILNVWRVTDGPNNDWPLAVCDYQTVSLEDTEMNDVIHETYVGESMRAYYNPDHRWFYLSDQTVDDVVIFRNTDSRGMEYPCKSIQALAHPTKLLSLTRIAE